MRWVRRMFRIHTNDERLARAEELERSAREKARNDQRTIAAARRTADRFADEVAAAMARKRTW